MRMFAAALALLLSVRPAAAQELHGYVGASFFVSTQGSHTQGSAPSLPRSGVGGETWGGTAEAGIMATPHFGLGVEVTLPARIEAVQETDYFSTFLNRSRYRDATVAFVAHAYTPQTRGVRIGAVGGFGIVQESVFQSIAYAVGPVPAVNPTFAPFGAETEYTRWAPAIVAGADMEIRVGTHLSLVPQFRAHWVRRSDDPGDPMWFLGLDTLVTRGAVGLRASF